MTDSEVVLGIKFSDMDTFQGENLYFSGTALEEGVWTDAHGNTAFYPAGVIREAAKAFEGVDILCEHKGVPIGRINKTNPTELGFEVVEGVITSQRMISAIRESQKRGLSVRALVELDPIRKVVKRIFNPEEISLVEAPACKVCMLDEISEKEVVNAAVEESTMLEKENTEYPAPDCEQFSQDDEIYQACKEFASEVDNFRKAQAKWNSMFPDESESETTMSADVEVVDEAPEVAEEIVEVANASDEVSEVVESTEEIVEVVASEEVDEVVESTEEITEVVNAADDVTEQIVAEVVEEDEKVETEIKEEVIVEDELVVEEVVAEAPEVETVDEEVVVEAEEVAVDETETEDETEEEVALGASEVDELKAKLESTEIALASSMAELSVTKAELSALQDKVRSELVESVMSADPNANSELINGMTDMQLEEYKETVMRLSKPTVGGEKQSVKADQAPVELSAPSVEVDEKPLSLADSIISHLGRKQ